MKLINKKSKTKIKYIFRILLGQSSHIDILPYILLPLAGPEEFDEEDNDKLPIQLQVNTFSKYFIF